MSLRIWLMPYIGNRECSVYCISSLLMWRPVLKRRGESVECNCHPQCSLSPFSNDVLSPKGFDEMHMCEVRNDMCETHSTWVHVVHPYSAVSHILLTYHKGYMRVQLSKLIIHQFTRSLNKQTTPPFTTYR